MKNEQVKKTATTADMLNVLKQYVKNDLVGLVEGAENVLRFTLPNGQVFLISVQEVV